MVKVYIEETKQCECYHGHLINVVDWNWLVTLIILIDCYN